MPLPNLSEEHQEEDSDGASSYTEEKKEEPSDLGTNSPPGVGSRDHSYDGYDSPVGHESPKQFRNSVVSSFAPQTPLQILPTPQKNIRNTILPTFRSFFEASPPKSLYNPSLGTFLSLLKTQAI